MEAHCAWLRIWNITGSKQTFQIRNRLGLDYNEVKALEIELAFSAGRNDRDTPDSI